MSNYLTNIEKFARQNKIPVILDDTKDYLQNLCKELKPKHILEIGMAIGYSASCMLEVCDADILELEASLPNIELARQNFENLGFTDRVKIIVGDCVVELAKLLGQKFDLIFLDGPKGHYPEMLPDILPLLADNGVFVSDNVLFRGMVRDGENISSPRYVHTVKALQKFLELLEKNENLDTKVLHIGDGLAVVKKKIKGK